MIDLETAWAAGLFEGEGHIGLRQADGAHWRSPRVRLALVMTDEDVVRRFATWAGYGRVRLDESKRRSNPNHLPQWAWETGDRQAVESILVRIVPHLGRRRTEKAREALVIAAYRPPARLRGPHGNFIRREAA